MSKKRGNGEGSITFYKSSNRYMAQYTKPNGKRGTVYGKTRDEARKKLTKALAEIQTNTYTDKSKITLNTYTEIFAKFEDTCDENYISYLEANKVGLQ